MREFISLNPFTLKTHGGVFRGYLKCFNDFKVEGLKRVNVITGKNNVGKTAFMEAAHINTSAIRLKCFFCSLFFSKTRRETLNILSFYGYNANNTFHNYNHPFFLEQNDGFNVISDINKTVFNIGENNGIKEYIFYFHGETVQVNSRDFSFLGEWVENNHFIDNFGLPNEKIIYAFSKLQELDQEQFLKQELVDFDSNITDFKIINGQPKCKINDEYLELTELGDGTKHLISIIISLFQCKDGYLFIDEIDNGIHCEQLDNVWRIILNVSKKYNVQVFAVTHSKECLESYARVVKKLEDEEIALIELGESDGVLKSIVFNYDGVMHQISQGLKVRGW